MTGRTKLVKTEYKIAGPFAPALRIAVLPDFHDGDPGQVLDMIEKDAPDLIAIPGDFVLGRYPDELALRERALKLPGPEAGREELVTGHARGAEAFLKGSAAVAPTYVSMGNHEFLMCEEDLEWVRDTGVTLLDNEWAEAEIGGGHGSWPRIFIGGVSAHKVVRYRRYREYLRENGSGERYPHRDHGVYGIYRTISSEDTEWLEEFEEQDGYRIVLCHHPEYWCRKRPWLFRRDADLVLAGHAHGGQVSIGNRGLWAPGQGLMPWLVKGVHEGPRGCMVISRGVTNSAWPVPRPGNPCEVVYINIGLSEGQ